MKAAFLMPLLVALSGTAFAAPAATSSATTATVFQAGPTERKAYFTTNILDLANGRGNATVDFFVNNKVALNFNLRTSSSKETIKNAKDDQGLPVTPDPKRTVDRSAYGLGMSYWAFGNEARQNLIVTPYLAFGTARDYTRSENSSGIGLKLTGLVRVTKDVTVEAGFRGDSTEDSEFKGDGYAGVGYLF